MNRFVVISGCSGGGKSTLLAELSRRGHAIVEEPGRRIVQEEVSRNGTALPWIDAAAFLRRAIAMSLADRTAVAASDGWVFFDRGLVDAAAGLEHLTGEKVLAPLAEVHRYYHGVFLAPPWPEIFRADAERRHNFESAEAEYLRLLQTYEFLGYEVFLLPKVAVNERADFILNILAK